MSDLDQSFYKFESDYCILRLKVLPNSSKNLIVGSIGDRLKIKITAPANDGKANKELVLFLSKEFKVAKSHIEIIAGHLSACKTIRLPLNDFVLRVLGLSF